jgi:hypothetical protein
MEEHTLGPWSVDGSATTDFDVVCADGRIAMVNGEDWSADMAEANAYLLAAAPELLGAVQLALRALNVAPRFKVRGIVTRFARSSSECFARLREPYDTAHARPVESGQQWCER